MVMVAGDQYSDGDAVADGCAMGIVWFMNLLFEYMLAYFVACFLMGALLVALIWGCVVCLKKVVGKMHNKKIYRDDAAESKTGDDIESATGSANNTGAQFVICESAPLANDAANDNNRRNHDQPSSYGATKV